MASMSELSITRKLFGYCTAWLSSCRTDTQKPWNVFMYAVSLSPMRLCMRARISFADLFEKVTHSMFPGSMPISFTR